MFIQFEKIPAQSSVMTLGSSLRQGKGKGT
jgi:hypothetical protein